MCILLLRHMKRLTPLLGRTKAINMINLRQAWLKHKARKYLKKYDSVTQHFNCGTSLTYYISPKAHVYKNKYNKIIDKLTKYNSSIIEIKL